MAWKICILYILVQDLKQNLPDFQHSFEFKCLFDWSTVCPLQTPLISSFYTACSRRDYSVSLFNIKSTIVDPLSQQRRPNACDKNQAGRLRQLCDISL